MAPLEGTSSYFITHISTWGGTSWYFLTRNGTLEGTSSYFLTCNGTLECTSSYFLICSSPLDGNSSCFLTCIRTLGGSSLYCLAWIGTPEVTLSCFQHPRRHCISFSCLYRIMHYITYSSLERHPKWHFITFSRLYWHPQGISACFFCMLHPRVFFSSCEGQTLGYFLTFSPLQGKSKWSREAITFDLCYRQLARVTLIFFFE